jgi:TPR repeat protein
MLRVVLRVFLTALMVSAGSSILVAAPKCSSSDLVSCDEQGLAALESQLLEQAKSGEAWALSALGDFYRYARPPFGNPGKAASAYEKAAAAGEVSAMIPLADMLFRGDGIAADAGRAQQLVERAEKAGLVGRARKTLGDHYRAMGDPGKAVSAYEKAVAAGERGAMLPLAQLLFKGEGVKRDEKRALELVERAEKAGMVGPAQNTLGDYYRSSGQLAQAIAAFEQASDAGEPWAMIPLADMLFKGEGGKRDEKRALDLLERAEKAGLVGPAQKASGDYYRSSGQLAQAIAAYERASDAGDRWAMIPLAQMLFKGQGVKRDEKRALELLARAEKSGLVGPAQNTLGDYYLSSGQLAQAIAAFERASDAGEPWAMIPLADMLFRGDGGKRDEKRALELVGRAEKAGLVGPAQKTLGDYYRSTGAFEKAASAYGRALDAGDRWAMLPLAQLLFKGQGVKRNQKRALELVERAEKAGMVGPAQNILGDYYRDRGRYRRAVAAYEAALLAGEIWATIPLADMLYRGQGAKQDRKRAMQLAERAEAAGLKWDGADLWYQTMILTPSNAQKKKCATIKPLRVTDYDTNATALPKSSESLIKRFAADVVKSKCHVIAVGYTSPSGSPQVNERIGLARAEAAKARLVELGVKMRQVRTQAATGSKAVSVSVVP